MRQSLITLGFFAGILSLPIAITAGGESMTQANRTDTHIPAVVTPALIEAER